MSMIITILLVLTAVIVGVIIVATLVMPVVCKLLVGGTSLDPTPGRIAFPETRHLVRIMYALIAAAIIVVVLSSLL